METAIKKMWILLQNAPLGFKKINGIYKVTSYFSFPDTSGACLHCPRTNITETTVCGKPASKLQASLSGPVLFPPQWGAADAEIKIPLGENTELKRSPFKAWSRSVHSHTCHAYCRGFFFLAYFYTYGPFTCIFSKTSPDFSCVGCG